MGACRVSIQSAPSCVCTCRGWLSRAQHGDQVEALYNSIMADLAGVAREWGASIVEPDPKQASDAVAQ